MPKGRRRPDIILDQVHVEHLKDIYTMLRNGFRKVIHPKTGEFYVVKLRDAVPVEVLGRHVGTVHGDEPMLRENQDFVNYNPKALEKSFYIFEKIKLKDKKKILGDFNKHIEKYRRI